jgi:hypothetical protein
LRKNQIIFIVFGIVIIAGALFLFDNIQNKTLQPPKLFISEVEWDYGLVKPGGKYTHIFTIKNKGDEELIIERLHSSCGCVKTSISTKSIQPGKSTQLKAIFDMAGYEGKVEKHIYIKSNDPQEPDKTIILSAEIEHQPKPIMSISKNEWNLDLISQGDVPTLSLIIHNPGDENLIIDRVNFYKNIEYNFTLPLTIHPNEKYKVVLTYNSAGHELGEVKEAVWIYSNDPHNKDFSLRIRGYIKECSKPAISISPVGLTFDLATNLEEGLIEKFSIENLGEKAAKIISIKSSVDYLIPLHSEFFLNSGEEEELQIELLQNKSRDDIEEETVEYIYLTIALPVKINK